ncbi:MAG: hypothetical protein HN969_00630 [Verrucomicrobia bacterium]|nr:hypothetical protein [Verrucomicrobiota bacterium]
MWKLLLSRFLCSKDKKDPPDWEGLWKNDWMNYFPLGNIISLFSSLESIMYCSSLLALAC